MVTVGKTHVLNTKFIFLLIYFSISFFVQQRRRKTKKETFNQRTKYTSKTRKYLDASSPKTGPDSVKTSTYRRELTFKALQPALASKSDALRLFVQFTVNIYMIFFLCINNYICNELTDSNLFLPIEPKHNSIKLNSNIIIFSVYIDRFCAKTT